MLFLFHKKWIKQNVLGRTFTEAAINDVIDNGFTVVNGARAISEGVPRVLVLLTDGYSSDDATAAAARVKFYVLKSLGF